MQTAARTLLTVLLAAVIVMAVVIGGRVWLGDPAGLLPFRQSADTGAEEAPGVQPSKAPDYRLAISNCVQKTNGQFRCTDALGAKHGPYEAVALGPEHGCGLRPFSGKITCWGTDRYGQASPPSGAYFLSVSAGETFSCGLTVAEGKVCWGHIPRAAKASADSADAGR